MGGVFEIKCFPQPHFSKEMCFKIFESAFDEVERIENLLTEFRPSPLQKINEYSGIQSVCLPQEALSLIETSISFSERSGGIFDMTYPTLAHPLRESAKRGEVLSIKEISRLSSMIDYRLVKIDSKKREVFLPQKEMKLGLGGIGKGYAVDRAFKILEDAGLINFSVNGSGDLRVHSHKEAPRKWRFGIRNPFHSDSGAVMGLLEIESGAICTSGNDVNTFQSELKGHHHILNPKEPLFVGDFTSVSVYASTAMEADVQATILMNKRKDLSYEYAEKEALFCIWLKHDGSVKLSPRALQGLGKKVKHSHEKASTISHTSFLPNSARKKSKPLSPIKGFQNRR